MSASLLFLASTLLLWFGVGALAGAVYQVVRIGWERSRWWWIASGAGLIFGSGIPHDLGRPTPKLWLPLVFPVMPFPSWLLLSAALIFLPRLCLGSVTGAWRWRPLLGWAAFIAVCLSWQAHMDPPKLLRGALGIEPAAGAGLFALLVGGTVVVARIAQNRRGIDRVRNAAVTLALVAGSALFCLPLLWLLLTSFKEQSDNTGDHLIWVPMVTQTHAYFDTDRPYVSTVWRGERVWGTLAANTPHPEIDVERPYPLMGWRVPTDPATTRPEQRLGTVVTTTYRGQPVTAFVRRELVGGEREVEVLSPPPLQGRRFTTTQSESQNVRHPGLRWQNYTEALEWLPPETGHGLLYLRNSLWLVLTTVVGTLLSCSFVAYGFSRVRFPGRSALFGLLVATMMLPTAVTMLPRFLVWRWLGAVDTLVPVWLPHFTASAFNVFLLRQFFKTIPVELEDAAKIDGCNPLRTYWQVMLPQIKPALAVIGVWAFMGAWNDFMGPLLYVSSAEKLPVSYAVQLFSSDKGGEFGLMMAFATLSTLPVLAVFLFGQKYFVEGVQLSGLGGK